MTQPAETTENRPLADIFPYPNNARNHSDKQIALLAKLIDKYGIDQPIVVDEDGVILKGHGRRLAALKLGLTHFPVVVQQGLSDADKRGLRIADNQATLVSTWDPELIRLELQDLKAMQFDMNLFGFSDKELARLSNDTDEGVEEITSFEPIHQILIECANEQEQLETLEKLQKDGIKCRALVA